MINIQNTDDNECFIWCLVRYLNPKNPHPVGITKAGKDFLKRLAFKGIKFPVKIRDIYKIEKKKIPSALVFFGYENKEKHLIYISQQCCEEKHFDLLLIGEENKTLYSYQRF